VFIIKVLRAGSLIAERFALGGGKAPKPASESGRYNVILKGKSGRRLPQARRSSLQKSS
jgi:hypothetical protein